MRLHLAAPVILAASLCSAQQQTADEDRDVSWTKLVTNIAEDQKAIWLFPRQLTKRRNLIPAAAFALTGTALMTGADPAAARYFRNTTELSGFNHAMPGMGTSAAILAAPFALYGAGLLRKDSKMTRTALLAVEAVADAEIVTEVFKPAVSRWRPSSVRRTAILRTRLRKAATGFRSRRILHEHRFVDRDSQAWSLRKVQIALLVHERSVFHHGKAVSVRSDWRIVKDLDPRPVRP